MSKSLTWGTDLSGSLQGAGGVGGLLLITDHSALITSHFHYDGNGNVTHLIDATGTITATYRYDAFGNTLVATGIAAADNKYRFSTKPFDGEIVGALLYYYGYRYYEPATGRWPSRDPINELSFSLHHKSTLKSKRSGNPYSFINNKLPSNIDFLGLMSFDWEDWSIFSDEWFGGFENELEKKGPGDPHGGDYRHCYESCRLTRRAMHAGPGGAGIAAAVIKAWNEKYEDDSDPGSVADEEANWCGYRQAFKIALSCEEACECCVKRPK
ncbi:MAG: RHS repeat-associated core domain-containing protein [Verrucomicrobiota bacterium]